MLLITTLLSKLYNVYNLQKIMEPEPRKKSMRMIMLMLGIKKYLDKSNVDLENFLSKMSLRNPSEINEFQLQKIVAISGCNFDTMDIYELLEELKRNQPIMKKSDFVTTYQLIIKQYSKQNSQPSHKKIPDQTLQIEKKMLKLGLKKLDIYIKKNDVIELFNDCDPENTGYLDKRRFNKLLISTDIKELSDRNIRHVLIKKIFAYYKNEQMSLQDFLNFFKIKLPPKEPEQKKKEELKYPPIEEKNFLNPNVPAKNHLSPNAPYIMKKQDKVQPVYIKPQIKYTQSDAIVNDDYSDIASSAPRAYSLYRLGIPPPEQLQFLFNLEQFLEKKKQFSDPENPKTSNGNYLKSSEIFRGRYEIFQMAASVLNREKSRIGLARQIQPKDIIQGQVGDCYFLSSIASVISFYPEVISDKILFQVSEANYYVCKLFVDGEWIYQETDDSFPCRYGKPIYAKPHGNQIWVMLIEKCWAKVYGSFQAIDSGTPTEGFRALTGAPSEYVLAQTFDEQKKLYTQLEEAYEKKHVVTVSGSKLLNQMSENEQNKIGLISGHAYSFLKFLKINGETIVKMRNPWGKKIWLGDWSFSSSKWTKTLRDKYNYNFQPDDGSFYIPWQMFIKYFHSFVFCRLDPTYIHTSFKLKPKLHKSEYLRMVVTEEGKYDIGVYQQSKRKYPKNPNYDFSDTRIIIVQENTMQYICSCNRQSQVSHVEEYLSKGSYIVACKVNWDPNQTEKPVNLTAYGPGKVYFEKINRDIAPTFKKGMIESYARKNPGKVKYYEKLNIPDAFNETQFSIETGIGYIRVKNPSNKWFATTMSMKKMTGMKVIKPQKLPQRFDMNPGTEGIIGFFISARGYSYESSESMETKG